MKPMLAARLDDLSDLEYPMLASPKLDGVRGLVIDGVLHSRNLKPIRNRHVYARFSNANFTGLDGELIVGDPTAKDAYRATNSACARADGKPDVKFYVFDKFNLPGLPFWQRHSLIKETEHIILLPHKMIKNENELLKHEAEVLAEGYEGLILRSVDGIYKFGRSTIREAGMVKLKRFHDSEALIIEVVEELQNTNEAKRNVLGKLERSSHKANMVPKGRAGALHVEDVHTGVRFHIGTGMNDRDRRFFWENRKKVVGKFIKYKHFTIGAKDLPRFPVFLGLREKWDM